MHTCNIFGPNPAHHRPPCLNSVITFSGDLLTVQDSATIVSVDEIAYLSHPGVFHDSPDHRRNEMEAIN
jgi:hypothetical protein